MRILTVCERGNCRSVAAAYVLKDQKHYNDVIACGVNTVQPDTFRMLADWADKILVFADEAVNNLIPEGFEEKTIHCDIGIDRWHNSKDPDLLKIVTERLDSLGL